MVMMKMMLTTKKKKKKVMMTMVLMKASRLTGGRDRDRATRSSTTAAGTREQQP